MHPQGAHGALPWLRVHDMPLMCYAFIEDGR